MPSDEKDLKRALGAFKKRMKITQLDQDSRLTRSPLTGARETIVAIQPPAGFGREIWGELVAAGYLKDEGGGFYQLIKKD